MFARNCEVKKMVFKEHMKADRDTLGTVFMLFAESQKTKAGL